MRNTTKLAGTKDMANMTQMDTSTSTEVVILGWDGIKGQRSRLCMYMGLSVWSGCFQIYLQRHLRELLFGEVERMVESFDAELGALRAGGQISTQDSIVHDIEERSDTVPALIIEPNLKEHTIMSVFLLLQSNKCP